LIYSNFSSTTSESAIINLISVVFSPCD